MHWIIAALIVPVPLFHLWLHGLLPWWRKHPLALYGWGALLWIGAFTLFPILAQISPVAFVPSGAAQLIGSVLQILGALAAVWSVATLGGKRFFVWAVVRPEAVPTHKRTAHGPFAVIPHPAYTGYVAVALGNLLSSGKLYLAGVLVYLLITTPLIMWLEEEELKRRVG